MPVVRRSQLLAYAALTLLVVVLGARALRTEGAASAPPPEAVLDGATAPPADAGSASGASPRELGPSAEARAGARPAGPDAPGGSAAAEGASDVLVHVAGAVRQPGVYRLAAGARVEDAVTQAGGPRRGADVHGLNLAAKVTDGQQVLVPRRGQAAAPVGGRSAAASSTAGSDGGGGGRTDGAAAVPPGGGGVVDVNIASVEELETLDGVGPAIAQKIVAWREANGGFRSVDDLAQVSGIGPKKLEAMRPRVAV